MEYVIVSITSISIMVIFSLFVIKNVVKRIDKNVKKYFLEKLQDYDYIIEEKKDELEKINNEVEILKEEKTTIKELEEYKKNKSKIEKQIKQVENQKTVKKEEIEYKIPTPKYREEEFFKTYKKLKKQFNVDNEKILKDFIKKLDNKKEDEENKELIKIRENFNEENIYQCSTLKPEEQYKILEEILDKKQRKLINLEKYDKEQFSIINLIEKINKRIKETDPTIYVYVANGEKDYNYLDKRIKTEKYKNMSEGIIIKYHNKMYDYSI